MTLPGRYAAQLFEYVRTQHPRSLTGIEEAREIDPARFDHYADLLLGWAERVLGPSAVARTVDSFVRFSIGVNLSQGRYELDGHYENQSYQDCYDNVYSQQETMDDYLWGVYLTNFLWAHHLELSKFFEDRFLSRLPANARIVELAPGHGGWGLMALQQMPNASLTAFDISPSSIQIASSLARASGLESRAQYTLKNALELTSLEPQSADAVICNFLIEHLEQPHQLLKVFEHLLVPGGRGFLSGALTAAQVDHIYEFKRESELVQLAEAHGMRVLETMSVGPARTLPRAKYLPRSMSLIVQRRTKDFS